MLQMSRYWLANGILCALGSVIPTPAIEATEIDKEESLPLRVRTALHESVPDFVFARAVRRVRNHHEDFVVIGGTLSEPRKVLLVDEEGHVS